LARSPMRRSYGGMSLSFPPFTPAVKWLLLANTGVFLLTLLLHATARDAAGLITSALWLLPDAVVRHGYLWQVATYSFLHLGLFHILFNMLSLWMFGATLEGDWGSGRFLQFYFFCVAGAALTTIGISYTHVLGVSPLQPTVGASGGVYGILMAFGLLYGEQELFLFPFPFRIKAKYMVAILIFVAVAGAFGEAGGIASFAHLGGLFFGYAWVRWMPRRGMGYVFSESYYGLRNRYFKWKRRRAARKFEVYMRKVSADQEKAGTPRSHFFDEYGNYRGPGSDKPSGGDKDDSESRWVH